MNRVLMILIIIVISTINLYSYKAIIVQNGNDAKLYQVTELQKALDSAAVGSDVYLPGYDFSGTTITIRKKLNIYGTGFYSSATNETGKTILGTLTYNTGSDSTLLEGVYIDNVLRISYTATHKVSNLMFRKCNIRGLNLANGDTSKFHTFKDCILYNPTISSKAVGIKVYNSIIDPNPGATIYGLIFESYNTSYINCILHYPDVNGSKGLFWASNSAFNLFENCIFLNTYELKSLGLNNGFVNCLSVYNQTDWGVDNYNVDCLINQNKDSIFVDTLDIYSFSEDFDYHLNNNCLGKDYGTDGTDLGIYGGTYPYKELGIPIIPYIKNYNSANKTVNGTLEVNVEVESQTE
ncbi:MAG: hypothetical protein CVV22_06915 [Ignavibacteriae bacterium HGW-Ignavibacteriae-1]|jgi:hypothetical protein|nr:MAG: hypothetical protein CVV22_06915 [Ignavibacteriae bacterium HGW-Ignavibacteriae-1]